MKRETSEEVEENMAVSEYIKAVLEKSSWIRKMFEEGARLKAIHGAENVFDFSIGNPNLPPPERFTEVLRETVSSVRLGDHAYMPNTGYPHVCQAVAGFLSKEHGVTLSGGDVMMTCGAAGGINAVLKALLNPGEEVVAPAPFFVEYAFYAENHGGILKTVPTRSNFTLDLDAIDEAVNEKTRAVIINSPNNPTGQVYSKEQIAELGRLLEDKSARFKRTVYLVSDEPYRKIVYDGTEVASVFGAYANSIVVSSYSKELSIPGERLGYVAVHPEIEGGRILRDALALANRILGFVNAPALMQRVVGRIQGLVVDVEKYRAKRDMLCEGLQKAGYQFEKPSGAFYLFPRSPIKDDVEFVRLLQKELVLTVPGSGFGGPGHFRISYCVDDLTIQNALPAFERAIQNVS